MSELPYPCNGTPLQDKDLTAAAQFLGVDVATVWSVLSVETRGCGFLKDRRPAILYERHIFHRLTGGKFDDNDISSSKPGGYIGGAGEYGRLGKAVALDAHAALQSASWGLGQIMGENFAAAGYSSVEAMVQATCDSEAAHLQAFTGFVKSSHLHTALQNKDWAAFARGYNGPNYVINHYDDQLASFYKAFHAGGDLPDLLVRTAQVYLRSLGYGVQAIDGKLGPMTLTALHNFQHAEGQPLTPGVTESVVAALAAKVPPPHDLVLV